MVRKVKKYVKSVVCVVLMLSLVMPMYAANEASDPSAFITKEEFDKALADFNQRLTIFEAGINSKIDSQVTSYLDRNGIWNGKDQTCEFTDSVEFGLKCVKKQDVAIHSYDDQSETYGSSLWMLGNIGDANQILIDKIDKTGLLWLNTTMVVLFIPGWGSSTRLGSTTGDHYTFNNTGLLEIWSKVDHKHGTNNLTEWSWQKVQQSFAGVTLYQSAFKDEAQTLKFFVETGDQIIFYGGARVSGTVGSDWDGNGNAKWAYKMHINSAKVY